MRACVRATVRAIVHAIVLLANARARGRTLQTLLVDSLCAGSLVMLRDCIPPVSRGICPCTHACIHAPMPIWYAHTHIHTLFWTSFSRASLGPRFGILMISSVHFPLFVRSFVRAYVRPFLSLRIRLLSSLFSHHPALGSAPSLVPTPTFAHGTPPSTDPMPRPYRVLCPI